MSKIVITGASRGIGLSTALELARAGYQVVAAMGNPTDSPELSGQADRESLRIRIETAGARRDEAKARLALVKAGPWQPDIEIALRPGDRGAKPSGARRSRFEPHVGHGAHHR